MLVLSRKMGERIVVPELGITIAVVEIKGKHVRLGLTAPADVAVHREEVWQRMNWVQAPAPKPRNSSRARSA